MLIGQEMKEAGGKLEVTITLSGQTWKISSHHDGFIQEGEAEVVNDGDEDLETQQDLARRLCKVYDKAYSKLLGVKARFSWNPYVRGQITVDVQGLPRGQFSAHQEGLAAKKWREFWSDRRTSSSLRLTEVQMFFLSIYVVKQIVPPARGSGRGHK